MTVEIFTVCDAASVSGGKLSLLGSFDTIVSESFPMMQNLMAIVCKLRFDADEVEVDRNISISLSFLDPDLKEILKPAENVVRLEAEENKKLILSQSCVQVWQQVGFRIEKPGEYYFQLKIDGVDVARIPLFVKKIINNNLR